MEITVRVPPGPDRIAVVGIAERNLKMIRETLGVNIAARDDVIRVSGGRGSVAVAQSVLDRISRAARERHPLSRKEVLELIADEASQAGDAPDALDALDAFDGVDEAETRHAAEVEAGFAAGAADARPPRLLGNLAGAAWEGDIHVYAGGRPIRPKTANQRHYLDAIRRHDLVFGIGPAGTGKTYLAVAAAVHLLKVGRVQRVVLARPAVEAGERLGFLPGDLHDKVNPYLRPLIDALHDMLDYPTIRRFMENDVIEISPLAFMRGRTLNNAAVILDEAQNTTRGQMKMFLTRLGHGSRAIVTGDTTQVDLPDPAESGLIDAARRLTRVSGVKFVQLLGEDVVRHPLVQRIVEAYGEQDDETARSSELRRMLSDASPFETRSDEPPNLPPRG